MALFAQEPDNNTTSSDKKLLLSLLRQTEFYITAENYERAKDLREQATVIF